MGPVETEKVADYIQNGLKFPLPKGRIGELTAPLESFFNVSHIDYYTNSIHGIFENKEVILYNFNKCGWINDNRQNSYEISCGLAGIFIQIKPNK